jgi:molybdopterin converting factor small subunit
MTKTINVRYFAQYRAGKGGAGEVVLTSAGTPRQLYDELGLGGIYPFEPRSVRVAINDEFAHWDGALENGDTVVFITPVAGG